MILHWELLTVRTVEYKVKLTSISIITKIDVIHIFYLRPLEIKNMHLGLFRYSLKRGLNER